MMGLILLREPIITLLFQWNQFTAADTVRTASVTILYALGLPFYSLNGYLIRGFHKEGYDSTYESWIHFSYFEYWPRSNIHENMGHVWFSDYLTDQHFCHDSIFTYSLRKTDSLWDTDFVQQSIKIGIASLLLGIICFITADWFGLDQIGNKFP